MKNKKAVSPLVGYVLLVVFAILISAGVYTWLKSYVPAENLSCKDGVSFFVREADFNNSLSQQLNVTIKNNGRFSIAGFFIHATNDSAQNLAVIDLSQYLNTDYGGIVFGNSVQFSPTGGNTLKPGEEATYVFDVPVAFGALYSLDIVPTIFQTENNRERFVSCSDEKVKQIIGEAGSGGGACTPSCSGKVCGSDGCGGLCGTCDSGFFCDGVGQCVSSSCTPAADPCGTQQCGTATNGTCGTVLCGAYSGSCQSGYACNATYQCESLCGNGNLDSGETCDGGTNCQIDCSCPSGYIADGSLGCTTVGNGVCDAGETCSQEPVACEGQQAQCVAGQTCQSGVCNWQSGAYGEDEYCIDLGHPGGGNCVANTGQCTSQNGINENAQPGASTYCPGQVLCCFN